MPFSFFKWFKIGPARVGVGKRGPTTVRVGRVSKSRGRTMRVSIPTGIPGLRFSLGGKRKSRRK